MPSAQSRMLGDSIPVGERLPHRAASVIRQLMKRLSLSQGIGQTSDLLALRIGVEKGIGWTLEQVPLPQPCLPVLLESSERLIRFLYGNKLCTVK